MKAAKLYAWVALQTLPEEMVISPCLLDFLEKALETIPITPIETNYTGKLGLMQKKHIPVDKYRTNVPPSFSFCIGSNILGAIPLVRLIAS